ncbi:hypothetical protein DPX16_20859 [Anabarilius grahami]|uniref:Uncharacterized protein n=1 Tax=Anabarilius grahami TaxID=495550 RepID=A0A3N0XSZ0_ANAGA|nr:hypothetical protein DPX16_20859 [Anabarilius grahami]
MEVSRADLGALGAMAGQGLQDAMAGRAFWGAMVVPQVYGKKRIHWRDMWREPALGPSENTQQERRQASLPDGRARETPPHTSPMGGHSASNPTGGPQPGWWCYVEVQSSVTVEVNWLERSGGWAGAELLRYDAVMQSSEMRCCSNRIPRPRPTFPSCFLRSSAPRL